MMRALISDLGNVLLHFDHRIIEQRLAEHFPSAPHNEESTARFRTLVQAFETGSVDVEGFLTRIAQLLGLTEPLDEAKFLELWSDIFWLNEELLDVLAQVHDQLTLVLLSNTNPLHIAFARDRFPELFELFDHTVYSYETGLGKPDKRIYEKALEAAGVPAEETLYFDDIAAYADRASELGIHGYQYVSIASLVDVLRIYGLSLRFPAEHKNSHDQ